VTNLSADQSSWRAPFTRDRLLIGAPILVGGVLALALLVLEGWPRMSRLQGQQTRLGELQAKQASLPLLERQLAKSQDQERAAKSQRALLVSLLAGQREINTFLAQLSRLAVANGVVIELYEPVPPALSAEAKAGQGKGVKGKSLTGKQVKAPKDPLETLGYETTSVLLQVRGPFQAVQAFLRRMEGLELLVQPSDLELSGVELQPAGKAKGVSGPVLTQLKLRLTFYDKLPAKRTEGPAAQEEVQAPS